MASIEPAGRGGSARHQHGQSCYWDLRDCSWHCSSEPPANVQQLTDREPALEPTAPPVEGSLVRS